MRNIHITRKKSFVGCLAKMQVYIEDPRSNDLTINGVNCRKLGTLKNGEEKVFEVGEESAKVYVIAGKMSKEYCNDFYQIPEGDYDVFLRGQNRYNPATGNAFRFDGVNNEEIVQNRKKGLKRGIIVLCIAFVAGVVLGLIPNLIPERVEAETFTNNELEITLTNQFSEVEYEGFEICYGSEDVAIFVLKEDFSLMEDMADLTLEEYGELVQLNNGFDEAVMSTNENGLTYYEYFSDVEDVTYCYDAFIYKTDDAFWLIQFAAEDEYTAENFDLILEWAGSVKFN